MPKPRTPNPADAGEQEALQVGLAPMLLEALALCGYGLWMLLGLALALGVYSDGRGEALVPLAIGAVLVSTGLAAALLRLRVMPEWRGWRIGDRPGPTREALLALATYFPMLAVAGLVRGDDDFWATRVAALVLTLCSLACLVTGAYGYRTRRLASRAGIAVQLPVSRVLAAWYAGSLWLWVCTMFQNGLDKLPDAPLPWGICLLLLALLLGLADGVGWNAIRETNLAEYRHYAQHLQSRRFVAAALIWAVPCLSVVVVPMLGQGRWLAMGASVACVIGQSLELWLYDVALTRLALARTRAVPRDEITTTPS